MTPSAETFGQALGAIAIAISVAFGIWRGHKKSDGKPPENRPPTPNETKAALESLRERIDHNHALADDDRRDMQRQLDRIERDVGRIYDRLDADARIGAALAKIREG